MQVVVVGSGYVGLVSGACLAALGHRVTCVDNDADKIELLRNGQVPIFEPGLAELIFERVAANQLTFTCDLKTSAAAADVLFIAVGTPARLSDGHADLTSVYAVARDAGRALSKFTVVVSKSTVPVGTGDEIERIIAEVNPAADFAIVSNPEFLREGCAISDFMEPDRIVVGASGARSRRIMAQLYQPITAKGVRLHMTARRSAELIKYATNAFLTVKITFINEIADLCEVVGTDVTDVATGVGLDSRVGEKFLRAGPGFGGSCFPKDTLALVRTAQDFGPPLRLSETTIGISDQRKRGMARKVIAACGGSVRGKDIAVLGLTFKPDTDDVRGAPSLDIIRALQDQGARVRVFDPVGMSNAEAYLASVDFVADVDEAVRGVDAAVIVTGWEQFGSLDFQHLRSFMRRPVLVDLCNLYNAEDVMRHGMQYVSVGRTQLQDPERPDPGLRSIGRHDAGQDRTVLVGS